MSRQLSTARVDVPARHLLGRSAGVVDVETLALLDPAHALSVDLELGPLPTSPTPVRLEVVEAVRERIARRDRRGRR
jgi:hypothetical protein